MSALSEVYYYNYKRIILINNPFGSVAKNPKIEAKFQFHIKEHKKTEYFSDNIQI
jgi:hypothetical protein